MGLGTRNQTLYLILKNSSVFEGATTFTITTPSLTAELQHCAKHLLLLCYVSERRYFQCRYAECRYAECRGAVMRWVMATNNGK
jgi:hypothetical protein